VSTCCNSHVGNTHAQRIVVSFQWAVGFPLLLLWRQRQLQVPMRPALLVVVWAEAPIRRGSLRLHLLCHPVSHLPVYPAVRRILAISCGSGAVLPRRRPRCPRVCSSSLRLHGNELRRRPQRLSRISSIMLRAQPPSGAVADHAASTKVPIRTQKSLCVTSLVPTARWQSRGWIRCAAIGPSYKSEEKRR
jgi:hypothetical protein